MVAEGFAHGGLTDRLLMAPRPDRLLSGPDGSGCLGWPTPGRYVGWNVPNPGSLLQDTPALYRKTGSARTFLSTSVQGHLQKRTHSLCEVEQQLGGDGINAELIGDFSKVHALPTVTGRHQGLKYITVDTMSALLEGKFSCLVEYFSVVDCCYPYEYQGGYIKGALSMPNTDEAVDHLQSQRLKAHSPDKRLVLVLHCEFSSERVPRTCRLLRSVDRSMNKYPALHYPELYILKGAL
ncbi:hypothetical protein J4Q44_G00121440 [Coregonus suidteri]|uniref:protein-tyrosine-phosphatase n=1 Tax=Coregonus suidteri TaxID=861788 RepID=A0AAN8QUW0_9TELE